MTTRKQEYFMKRITVIVSGRIQDVGYRAKVVGIAKELGLTGYVQNLEDGRVKMVAEGEEGVLDRFLDAIRIKNTLINVGGVEIEYSGATGEYANFYKLVGGGETDGKLDKASEYLKELIAAVKGGFREMKDEMRTGFGEMKDEIAGVKDEIAGVKDEIAGMRGEMRTGFGEVKEEIAGMKDEMRTGFETLGSKQDQTTDEIRILGGDLKSYIEWSTEKLRSELKEEIRTEFNEIKRAMKEHELCADATG